MKVVTAEHMMRIDRECAETGLPGSVLMENAGKAVAEEIRRILRGTNGKKIVILAGPGNNGGDGLVAARYLHEWKAFVSLYLFGRPRTAHEPNYAAVIDRNIPVVEVGDSLPDDFSCELSGANAIVDALFGTGKSRPLGNVYSKALETVNSIRQVHTDLKVIALDLPSGLDPDTGASDPSCLMADYTVTLAFPKPGLFNPPGVEAAGKVSVVDIGIPADKADESGIEYVTPSMIKKMLPKRPLGANKGTFGKLLAVTGSLQYSGAAYLACTGAMRSGAGLVTLAVPTGLLPIVASKLTETTYLPLRESEPGILLPEAADTIAVKVEGYRTLLAGCGLGQAPGTVGFVRRLLLGNAIPFHSMVVDADALNILSGVEDWWRKLPDNAILTPHPGEMARLTGKTVENIQANRLGSAVEAAHAWNKTVVLKGAYTVTALPDGRAAINPFANPGLATAGTGDVLAGIIAGLATQGLGLMEAAVCGAYLHGAAGERVREYSGETGMLASDLLPVLPGIIRDLRRSG